MKKRNVTISLPEDLLRDARHFALDRWESLSSLIAQALQARLRAEDVYEEAARRQLAWLAEGMHLGTGGKATWTREDLHER
jgi:predicted transcriptional regulator